MIDEEYNWNELEEHDNYVLKIVLLVPLAICAIAVVALIVGWIWIAVGGL